MTIKHYYFNPNISSGANNGTSEDDVWQDFNTALLSLDIIYDTEDSGYNPEDHGDGIILHCKCLSDDSRYSNNGSEWPPFYITRNALETAPLLLRGYKTTPGDYGLFKMLGMIKIDGYFTSIEGFDVSSSSSAENATMLLNGTEVSAYRCRAEHTGIKMAIDATYTGSVIAFCDAKSNSGSAIRGYRACVYGCRAYSSQSNAIIMDPSGIYGYYGGRCLVTGAGGNGIVFGNATARTQGMGDNIIYNVSGAGIVVNANTPSSFSSSPVVRNIIYSATDGIVDNQARKVAIDCVQNAIGGISGSRYKDIHELTIRDDIVLTANPFVDPENGDFRLNNVAGGGAVLRAAGFPIQPAYDWDNMRPLATPEGDAQVYTHPFMNPHLR
jgi:hypothetical protein